MKVREIYKNIFNMNIEDTNLNKVVKAVVLEFPNKTAIVANDNFGTAEKHMDFTQGREAAGLHPLQVVFGGLDFAAVNDDKFIGPDDRTHSFRELVIDDEH